MKLIKSTLLGSVAAFAAVAGVQAADLPSRKAAPVEYVKVCTAYGAGFFYIPGTDTCLRVGGRVRAEYRYTEPLYSFPGNGRALDASGFRSRGRLNVDSRTETSYGTLRAFFRYELTGNTGVYGGNTSSLDKGFVQFAGLTAGRAQSFFDFYADDLNWAGVLGSDNFTQNLFAYTATFGSGFSATLSLEDATQRRTTTATYSPAGERLPDVVGVLRADQAWGAAQLSGALHQLNSTALSATGQRVDTEYGFAVQGGVQFKLPMLAAGDVLWLQAAYADGALSYLGLGGSQTVGPLTSTFADGVIVAGDIKKTKGYGITGAFLHYWTPQLRQGVYANYTDADYPSVTTVNVGSLRDAKVYQIGSNLILTPVSGLDIGVEVFYTRLDPKGRVAIAPAGLGITRSSEDVWEGRLRVQRDF